jgi:nitrile hydratase accessory protein
MRVFAEPWEARAFAMVRALQDAGLVTPTEWTAALAEEVRRAQDSPAAADASYHHWLSALESVVAAKNLATTDTLSASRAAWARAAHRTPHGDPIELHPDDFDR